MRMTPAMSFTTERDGSRLSSIAKRGRKYWESDRPINPVLILTGLNFSVSAALHTVGMTL